MSKLAYVYLLLQNILCIFVYGYFQMLSSFLMYATLFHLYYMSNMFLYDYYYLYLHMSKSTYVYLLSLNNLYISVYGYFQMLSNFLMYVYVPFHNHKRHISHLQATYLHVMFLAQFYMNNFYILSSDQLHLFSNNFPSYDLLHILLLLHTHHSTHLTNMLQNL